MRIFRVVLGLVLACACVGSQGVAAEAMSDAAHGASSASASRISAPECSLKIGIGFDTSPSTDSDILSKGIPSVVELMKLMSPHDISYGFYTSDEDVEPMVNSGALFQVKSAAEADALGARLKEYISQDEGLGDSTLKTPLEHVRPGQYDMYFLVTDLKIYGPGKSAELRKSGLDVYLLSMTPQDKLAGLSDAFKPEEHVKNGLISSPDKVIFLHKGAESIGSAIYGRLAHECKLDNPGVTIRKHLVDHDGKPLTAAAARARGVSLSGWEFGIAGERGKTDGQGSVRLPLGLGDAHQGTIRVTETARSGWSLARATCSRGDERLAVTLDANAFTLSGVSAGDEVTCEVTNRAEETGSSPVPPSPGPTPPVQPSTSPSHSPAPPHREPTPRPHAQRLADTGSGLMAAAVALLVSVGIGAPVCASRSRRSS